ncbi:Repetin [Streptomyces spongiae]|uniref:Repetin n=1 Tax=Streptomyces spongiae TaxID=565072 RepID=A0A5N8XHT6_9ACTN|nr:Repetin [Streptomyces spongiae]MPY59040.1 Repetin [Streptomyces spongiae]
MNRPTRRTKFAVLGATVLLLATGVAASASASGSGTRVGADEGRQREAAALTGTAKMYRSAGDDMTFSFDAHLAAKDRADSTKATGTFRWSHYLGDKGGWAKARVDCLVTGGKVAVVSGVVTDTNVPDLKDLRVGITVHDTGRVDRLGYSWATTTGMGPKDLPKCVSTAPFEKVKKGTGDFNVVPWHPEY